MLRWKEFYYLHLQPLLFKLDKDYIQDSNMACLTFTLKTIEGSK